MHNTRLSSMLAAALTLTACIAGASTLLAQPAGPETFSATATVKSAKGAMASAPVVIVIERHTSDKERDAAVAALKAGGSTGLKQALAKMPAIGHIDVAGRTTPIKYAYARPVGAGRMVTVIADTPILYLGESLPGAKPKAGYELAFALLDLPGTGAGTGELGPAVKVKVTDGAVSTEDYGSEVVMLSKVEKKK